MQNIGSTTSDFLQNFDILNASGIGELHFCVRILYLEVI